MQIIFVIFYSPMVEWIYFQDAKNAEIAPTIEKPGIINPRYERKYFEKSLKNGIKSKKTDCD